MHKKFLRTLVCFLCLPAICLTGYGPGAAMNYRYVEEAVRTGVKNALQEREDEKTFAAAEQRRKEYQDEVKRERERKEAQKMGQIMKEREKLMNRLADEGAQDEWAQYMEMTTRRFNATSTRINLTPITRPPTLDTEVHYLSRFLESTREERRAVIEIDAFKAPIPKQKLIHENNDCDGDCCWPWSTHPGYEQV